MSWNPRTFSSGVLEEIWDRINQRNRDGEEERFLGAINDVFLLDELELALSYEAKGGKVGSFAALGFDLALAVGKLDQERLRIRDVEIPDRDDRVRGYNQVIGFVWNVLNKIDSSLEWIEKHGLEAEHIVTPMRLLTIRQDIQASRG